MQMSSNSLLLLYLILYTTSLTYPERLTKEEAAVKEGGGYTVGVKTETFAKDISLTKQLDCQLDKLVGVLSARVAECCGLRKENTLMGATEASMSVSFSVESTLVSVVENT